MKYIKEGTEFLDQLKDRVHDLYDENKELKQEIERLNNIINELEKYIIDFKEDYETSAFQPKAKVYIYWKDLIDKLQELKGRDKSEID